MKCACVLPGDNPDPTILKVGDYFYLTGSSLGYCPGLLLYKSKDLRNFSPVCTILCEDVGDICAPELVCNNGKYYIYFPVVDYNTGHIENFVVWSDNIEYGWSKPIEIGIVPQIDPGFVTDGEKSWLYFNDGMCVRLTPDLLHLAEKPIKRKEPWQYPIEWETEGMWDESPKLFLKNGFYYMITAEGGTAGPATSHMAVSFRSKSPLGPWEVSPYNPVIHTYSAEEKWWSTGHATYFEDTNGEGYFIFHGYLKDNQNMGRQTLLCRAEWTDDGWPIAADIDFDDVVLPDFCDDFNSEALNINWHFYKSFDKQRFTTGNGLMLSAVGNSVAESHPLCINSSFTDAVIETVITKCDANTTAGLLLFYNEKAHLGVFRNGERVFISYKNEEYDFYKTTDKILYLKMEKQDNSVRIFASSDKKEYKEFPEKFDVTDFQHNVYKGFLSCRPGITCFGNGNAHFSVFTYSKL